jgi:hypothetical protein
MYSKFYQYTLYFMCGKTLQLHMTVTNLPVVVTVMLILLTKSGLPKSSTLTPHLSMNLITNKNVCRHKLNVLICQCKYTHMKNSFSVGCSTVLLEFPFLHHSANFGLTMHE